MPELDLNKCNPELLSLEHEIVGEDYIIKYAQQYGFLPATKIGPDMLFVKEYDDISLLKSFSVIGVQYHNEHPCDKYQEDK